MLAKNLTFLSGADAAGVVLGARVPIILTSRADNAARAWRPVLWPCSLAHSRQCEAADPGPGHDRDDSRHQRG